MKRFCFYCAQPITEARRLAKGAIFCSPECKRSHERERRNARARDFCRLCGRRYRRSRTGAVLPPLGGSATVPNEDGTQMEGLRRDAVGPISQDIQDTAGSEDAQQAVHTELRTNHPAGRT